MTGIERLRQFAKGCGLAGRKAYSNVIAAIADQIEREHAERGETIRELSDRAAKQSDEIRVMRDVIVETCARLGVEGTGSTVDDAQVIWREISRRLMPAGMEWPRYEDSGPVRIGDVVNDVEVRSVVFRDDGILLSDCTSVPGWGTWRSYKEPIKRPAVHAGDGEPLEAGKTVWDVDGYGPLVVTAVPSMGEQLVVLDNGGTNFYRYPEKLTHKRPDSWERIEEDATKNPFDYCKKVGHKLWTFDNAEEFKASDLVRRCRALAERERGE